MSKRSVLWLHTALMGIIGLLFFVFPGESAGVWPWPLPPLAARFMGSLFLGGAACSFACLRSHDERGLFVMVLLGVGDALIASSGLLGAGDIGFMPRMTAFLAFFLGVGLLLVLTFLQSIRAPAGAHQAPSTRLLRGFFLVHLLVVLPVGVSMFFFPSWAQPRWPWQMTPVNVRLIGTFFFGAAFISAWALRQRSAEPLRPALALYAVFATLATVASIIHFGLFDPARMTTWAFFALYGFVAIGSSVFWLRGRSRA
ncbi:MAG TPA: hypothetical protein VKE95_10455 [Burkholderiales bacterium]|nr:hypothetical protein [Burkholderiales bacterium]